MWKMFCWGVFVGWLVEWVIDWLFWRKNTSSALASNTGTGMTGAALASGMARTAEPMVAASALAAVPAHGGLHAYEQSDLEAIEGIGPKIAELLRNNGITTFTQLSQAPMDHLVKILDAGGSRFKLANPQSWAEQAKLAAAQDWVALEKLQNELTGGVRLNSDGQ
jgi:predicted flap endonuclease-1-like 5' DNA nuclease